jgi:hypothetical protein
MALSPAGGGADFFKQPGEQHFTFKQVQDGNNFRFKNSRRFFYCR